MMLKSAIVGSMLLAVALSFEIREFDNNFIEYGDVRPVQISLPYPYQENHHKPVIVETVSPPIYSDIIVATNTDVTPSGFFSTAISCTYDAAKAVISFLLIHAPALIAGIAFALGVCKLTPLCDSQITIYEAQSELRSLATPERLERAAKFVREAVKKFNDKQNK